MAPEDSRFVSFIITLTPYLLRQNYVYVPSVVLPFLREVIRRKVYFHLPNGDIYECLFEDVHGCFIGLGKMIERFDLSSFCSIFFEYFGNGGFLVSVLSPTCVEIEYRRRADFFSSVFQTFDDIIPTACRDIGYSIEDDVYGSLLHYNSDGNGEPELHILFDRLAMLNGNNNHMIDPEYEELYREWGCGSNIVLILCERRWTVRVRKVGLNCNLCEGWNNFIRDLGVCLGDLCILSKTSVRGVFGVALFRCYVIFDKNKMLKGAHIPNKFVKYICNESISTGEIVIPKLFCDLYSEYMASTLSLKCGDSLLFSGVYNEATKKLGGLKDMFESLNVTDRDTLMFIYEGNGVFVVCHFTQSCSQSNKCSQLLHTSYGKSVRDM